MSHTPLIVVARAGVDDDFIGKKLNCGCEPIPANMRPVVLILYLLINVFSCFAQPSQGVDSSGVIRLIDKMLAIKNRDISMQDSLIGESVRLAKQINRHDLLLKLYSYWSTLKLQQNESNQAGHLSTLAIDAARGTRLEKTVFFRDAVTQQALCYSYLGKADSCISRAVYNKTLSIQAGDHFNHSVVLTIEAINRIGTWPAEKVEILFDSALLLAKKTASPHDDIMAGYNKAAFLKIAGQKDWVRSIEALTSLQEIIDHPDFVSARHKPYDRVPFWFRGARPSVYRELSYFYFQLSNLGDACYYQEEIVKEYKRTGNYAYLPYVWSDLAEYETFRNDEKKVRHIYDSSALLIREYYKKNEIPIPSFYYAAGWLAERENDFKNAILFYQKAKAAADPVFHVSGIALFRTYTKAGLYNQANRLRADIAAQLKASPIFFHQVLFEKELAGYHQLKGDKEAATRSLLEYYRLKDSMTTAARFYMINEAETRFKTREREKELALVNKEKLIQQKALDQKTWQVIFLIGSLIFLLGTLLLLYRFYKNKKQKALILKQKNQQIETLIRELHHRVKNNLQVVSSLMSLQSNRMDDDKARQALEEGRTRVDAMAMIHQKLYMDNELAAVDMSDYLESLAVSLANSFGYTMRHVRTTINMPRTSMDIDRAIPIGLIVNELVTNSFKHAFHNVADPLISIILQQTDKNMVELMVSDNGNGMPEAGHAKKAGSFGMKLIHTLVSQLSGELSTLQKGGTIFKINFKA